MMLVPRSVTLFSTPPRTLVARQMRRITSPVTSIEVPSDVLQSTMSTPMSSSGTNSLGSFTDRTCATRPASAAKSRARNLAAEVPRHPVASDRRVSSRAAGQGKVSRRAANSFFATTGTRRTELNADATAIAANTTENSRKSTPCTPSTNASGSEAATTTVAALTCSIPGSPPLRTFETDQLARLAANASEARKA